MGSILVLAPRSSISQGDVGHFMEAVEEHRTTSNGRMVLDFAQVPFLDSRGVEALWDLADRQREAGRTTKIAAVPELCREILELTGVVEQLDLYDSAESAVRSFL
jgi:anti-anti-sigma factor